MQLLFIKKYKINDKLRKLSKGKWKEQRIWTKIRSKEIYVSLFPAYGPYLPFVPVYPMNCLNRFTRHSEKWTQPLFDCRLILDTLLTLQRDRTTKFRQYSDEFKNWKEAYWPVDFYKHTQRDTVVENYTTLTMNSLKLSIARYDSA